MGIKTEALTKFFAFATRTTTVGGGAAVGRSEREAGALAALDRGFFCFIIASAAFADGGGAAFSLIAGLPRFFAGTSRSGALRSCVAGGIAL